MRTHCKGCMESGEHLPKISLFPRGPDLDAHYESIYSRSKVYLFYSSQMFKTQYLQLEGLLSTKMIVHCVIDLPNHYGLSCIVI